MSVVFHQRISAIRFPSMESARLASMRARLSAWSEQHFQQNAPHEIAFSRAFTTAMPGSAVKSDSLRVCDRSLDLQNSCWSLAEVGKFDECRLWIAQVLAMQYWQHDWTRWELRLLDLICQTKTMEENAEENDRRQRLDEYEELVGLFSDTPLSQAVVAAYVWRARESWLLIDEDISPPVATTSCSSSSSEEEEEGELRKELGKIVSNCVSALALDASAAATIFDDDVPSMMWSAEAMRQRALLRLREWSRRPQLSRGCAKSIVFQKR